jgi:hypothetical protein
VAEEGEPGGEAQAATGADSNNEAAEIHLSAAGVLGGRVADTVRVWCAAVASALAKGHVGRRGDRS